MGEIMGQNNVAWFYAVLMPNDDLPEVTLVHHPTSQELMLVVFGGNYPPQTYRDQVERYVAQGAMQASQARAMRIALDIDPDDPNLPPDPMAIRARLLRTCVLVPFDGAGSLKLTVPRQAVASPSEGLIGLP